MNLSTIRSRITALAARLRHREHPTSPVDSFDAILAAAIETGDVIIVPGIARWLGATPPEPDDSVDSYEVYPAQLSRTEAADA